MKAIASFVLALVLAACGAPGGTPDTACSSGLRWTHGDEESELMHPGTNCIECHGSGGEGPAFALGGTVFTSLTETTECFGLEGVRVIVTDATRKEFTLDTNSAGNFYLEEPAGVTFPVKARVVIGANFFDMVAETGGDCGTCHTETGTNGAPGRIIAP